MKKNLFNRSTDRSVEIALFTTGWWSEAWGAGLEKYDRAKNTSIENDDIQADVESALKSFGEAVVTVESVGEFKKILVELDSERFTYEFNPRQKN